VVLKDVDATMFDSATNVFLRMKQTPVPIEHESIPSESGVPSWKTIRENFNHIKEEYQKLKDNQDSGKR